MKKEKKKEKAWWHWVTSRLELMHVRMLVGRLLSSTQLCHQEELSFISNSLLRRNGEGARIEKEKKDCDSSCCEKYHGKPSCMTKQVTFHGDFLFALTLFLM